MLWFSKSLVSLSLLFLIFHSITPSSSVQPQCRPETRTALINLNCSDSFFRNQSDDCCSWPYVGCDSETGDVTSLSVYDGCFRNGKVMSKSSLFSLRHLQSLVIDGFELEMGSDAFDALTQNLTSLKQLRLFNVDMSSVPLASLMNLSSSLTSLMIYDCHLSGQLPLNFFHFPNLVSLILSVNINLGGHLPTICSNSTLPSQLTTLYLSYNSFSGPIPSWIVSLPNLKRLDLHNNLFSGEIGEFKTTSLSYLDLSNNKLRGVIPRSIFQQMKVELQDHSKINLSSNNLTGIVELQHLSKLNCTFKNLDTLGLSSCNLTEFPNFFISSKLSNLDLSNNQIQGLVPKWFPPTLIYLFASKNHFSGEIRSSICNITSLRLLDLSYNNLSGRIPPCIGNFKNIEWLDLSSNELVGKIPLELANLNRLSFFNVSHNHLGGPIPHGSQFDTFRNESFEGNLNLCGFPLSKLCRSKPPEQIVEEGDESSNATNSNPNLDLFGFDWRIVMMAYASGLVIGISIGYMLLYSNGKLHWLSERIVEEIEYRRAIRPKRRNARRSQRR